MCLKLKVVQLHNYENDAYRGRLSWAELAPNKPLMQLLLTIRDECFANCIYSEHVLQQLILLF